jgi:peptidoglycan hydrolase-like protein with peptidoglycan-binding domain
LELPVVPQNITVHLGAPNSDAQNVTVPFPTYIKNVASSEIYPTWPEQAIRANILAQISIAMNRVYTEWYRSRGFDFDITNSTAFDQSFVYERDIYANISRIVDEIFNDYIVKGEGDEPYFAAFCDGTTVTCPGLSQWGTVELANQGLSALDILKNYYGNDIRIVDNAPVGETFESYPGFPLVLGTFSNDVKTMQVYLNRISLNYPAIPKIFEPDGVFCTVTEDAVKVFQEIFKLPVTGIIDKATWYKIIYINSSVRKLAELESEGLRVEELEKEYPGILKLGDQNELILVLKYFLRTISSVDPRIPIPAFTPIFDQATKDAIIAYQKAYGLGVDGIVGRLTYNSIYRTYRSIIEKTPKSGTSYKLFPGLFLKQGSRGEDVTTVQNFINTISQSYPELPKLTADGDYGPATRAAVIAFQNRFGLEPSGIVDPLTWDRMAVLYSDVLAGKIIKKTQFPGQNLT